GRGKAATQLPQCDDHGVDHAGARVRQIRRASSRARGPGRADRGGGSDGKDQIGRNELDTRTQERSRHRLSGRRIGRGTMSSTRDLDNGWSRNGGDGAKPRLRLPGRYSAWDLLRHGLTGEDWPRAWRAHDFKES